METRSLVFADRDRQANAISVRGRVAAEAAPGNNTPPSEAPARRSRLDCDELAARIEQRIQAQTCGRVRNLAVTVVAGRVELQGRCATFYTKQLAQHAAMGVLEDEALNNEIMVLIAR